MHIELTLFGIVFIPLVVIAAFGGVTRLISLLILLSVFQAAAVLNVGDIVRVNPLIPYYAVVVVILLFALAGLLIEHRVRLPKTLGLFCFLLILFTIVAALGALVLPHLFSGIGVYSPRAGIDDQYHNLTALSPSLSNLAQVLYLVLNVLLVLYAVMRVHNGRSIARWVSAIHWSSALAVTIGYYQLVAYYAHLPVPYSFLYSAGGRAQGFAEMASEMKRVNSTFTEPSALAAFLVSYVTFVSVLWLQGRREKYPLLLGVAAALLAVLSTSSTAYVGLALLIIGLFLRYGLAPLIVQAKMHRKALVLFVSVFLCVGIMAVVIGSIRGGDTALLSETIYKGGSLSYVHRTASDINAIVLLKTTFGLGVGLGSDRPSSFAALLLSNTGVIGGVLFFGFIWALYKTAGRVSWSLGQNSQLGTVLVAAVWSLIIQIVLMCVSQPDLSSPTFWVWLLMSCVAVSSAYRISGVSPVSVGAEQNYRVRSVYPT